MLKHVDPMTLMLLYAGAAVVRTVWPFFKKRRKDPEMKFDWKYLGGLVMSTGYGALAAAPEALPALAGLPPAVSIPLAMASGAGMSDVVSRAIDFIKAGKP